MARLAVFLPSVEALETFVTPASSVLIVDDEPAVRDLMSRWASDIGLQPTTAADADEALVTLRTRKYDLAVVDVLMPGHNGLWLANEMHRDYPHTAVIIATAYSELVGTGAPQPDIADLLVKPFLRDRFALALERGRQWRKQALEELQWHAVLSKELRERTEQLCAQVRLYTDEGPAIRRLSAAMADRAPDALEHCARVAPHAVAVAQRMSLDAGAVATLEIASQLHDVGKAAMPEALLTKPSALAPGEAAIMRRHVEASAEILAASRPLASTAPIVLATHEWFGGGGYPRRIAGAAIPLASRIISVVDAYDTMTQAAEDRTPIGRSSAVSELLRCDGTQFDPVVVAAFLEVLGGH